MNTNWKGKLEKFGKIYDGSRTIGKTVSLFATKVCVANVAHAVIKNAVGNLDDIEGKLPRVATRIGAWVISGVLAEAGVNYIAKEFDSVFPDIGPIIKEITKDKTPSGETTVIDGGIIPTN